MPKHNKPHLNHRLCTIPSFQPLGDNGNNIDFSGKTFAVRQSTTFLSSQKNEATYLF